MTSSIPFIGVPIAAVFCYVFLMIALLSAEKNKLIDSFILLLLCFTLWTGGSMLMRLQIFPGYAFWYEISILALFAAPFLVYNFLARFVDAKDQFLRGVWAAGTFVMLVLTHFQVFLKTPVLQQLADGRSVYVYHMTWRIFIPTAFIVVILLSGVRCVLRGLKRGDTSIFSLRPLLVGLPVLVVGNLISIIPGNFFPFDTLSGLIYACVMFYALYRKRLFRMTLLVSRGVVLIETMVLVSVICIYCVNPLEQFINRYFPIVAQQSTLIIAILFGACTMLGYQLLRRIFNNLFLKDELRQYQKLQDFSLAVSRSLDLGEILALMADVVCSTLDVGKVYVCLLDETGQRYRVVHTATPLDPKNFSISTDNPCVVWFKDHTTPLILKDFQRTSLYKSMWDSEKEVFASRDTSCIMPLKCDDELVGMVLLADRRSAADYTCDDISFLESVQSLASVAVKNANLYEQARREAETDHLTGLLNRKSFMAALERDFERCRHTTLSLILLNLDDFKLYNQLYGSYAGDQALQTVARIISCTVGTNGTAGRYGGKEFAVSLPEADMRQAYALAQNIQEQVAQSAFDPNGARLKTLTMSGGVCVAPYGASTLKELVENADMAVYNAKRSGKNKILNYTVGPGGAVQGVAVPDNQSESTYEDYASTVYALTAAIDAKDHYTFSHSQNVAVYATALAKAAGLNEEHVRIIHEAALLHDIGKIAIPEHILSKPGKLTDEEYEIMKTHVEHSIAIIRHLPSLDYVIPAAIGHHERWDGRGYPRGIAGEDIPVGARCLAIADSFDAMVSARSYKKACTMEYAIQELKTQAGKQFDPRLAELFVKLLQEGTVTIA